MQAFIRIVEAGNITKAADQFNVAKSAMSKRLSALEFRLGITLINRTTRSLKLTNNGQAYYSECKRIIDDVNEVEATLQNKQTALSGNIKIAVPLSFGLAHLASAINEFHRIHPNIKIELDFNDRKVSIINEGYDLAIRAGQLDDSNYIARKITSDKTILVASQKYLDDHGIPKTVKDLHYNHVKLHYSNTSGILNFLGNNNETIQVNLPSVLISNNGDYLCQCALEGKGIISTPLFICHQYVKEKKLIAVLPDSYIPNSIGVYALYPPTRHLSRRIRSLIDFLVKYFGDRPIWGL